MIFSNILLPVHFVTNIHKKLVNIIRPVTGDYVYSSFRVPLTSDMMFTLRTYTFFALLLAFNAQATTSSQVGQLTAQNPSKDRFSLYYATELSTNAVKFGDPENTFEQQHSLAGRYTLTNGAYISSTLGLTQDYRGERKTALEDSVLIIGKGIKLDSQIFSLSLRAGAVLPFSTEAHRVQGLTTGLILSPILAMDFTNTVKGLKVMYRPSFGQNFHKYETAINGRSNTQSSLTQRILVMAELTDQLSLNFDNVYRRSWTYTGNTNDMFSFSQSVEYAINQRFAVSLGHALGGDALAPNGTDSNVRLFDKRQSQYFVGGSYEF